MVLGISKKRYNTQIIILFLGMYRLLKDYKDFVHITIAQFNMTGQRNLPRKQGS